MDDYTPALLPLDVQATNLDNKIRALEVDRQMTAAEINALDALANRDDNEQAELIQLQRSAERLDARITSHNEILDRIRAERDANNPPAAIRAE